MQKVVGSSPIIRFAVFRSTEPFSSSLTSR